MSHTPLSSQTEKLRQKPVTFVSAGFIEPLKGTEDQKLGDQGKQTDEPQVGDDSAEKEPTTGRDGAELGDDDEAETVATEEVDLHVAGVLEEIFAIEEEVVMADAPAVVEPAGDTAPFFFDLTGNKTLHHVFQQPSPEPTPRFTSVDPESDDEVILFKGRSSKSERNGKRGGQRKKPQFLVDKMRSKKAGEAQRAIMNESPSHINLRQSDPANGDRAGPSHMGQEVPKGPEGVNEEDAILADYIANMEANPDDDFLSQIRSFSKRELGGSDEAFGANSSGNESSSEDSTDEDDEDGYGKNGDPTTAGEDQDMNADMDDETLAHLLARQEQLGISSDELLLGNGTRLRSRRAKSQSNGLNSTSVTEAFGELDLTGFEPPVPRKGRRRKQPPVFNVSDSELEAALRKAWERDRERKKNRKLEREAKRVQGLLRKNADPEDLRVKYQSSMTVDDVKHELLQFLMDTIETIQFPPMDKQARMMVHEIAGKFKIKTQSTGNGDQRRPVLYRTKRTARYSEDQWEMAERDIANAAFRVTKKIKYFRTGVAGSSRGGASGGGGGKSSYAAVSYREGEIVGASIPELGQGNKGRAMLEKMGWAKGMGLGALENKGILEPVAQVVKTSKAGLG
ncbi:hypothetical protein OQA88_8861 [Cercophora sp. LCS_1]